MSHFDEVGLSVDFVVGRVDEAPRPTPAPFDLVFVQLAMGDQLVKFAEEPIVKSKHNGEYWQRVTKGINFAVADRLPRRFNQIIWKGMMGNRPYPKMAMDMFHQATKVDNHD